MVVGNVCFFCEFEVGVVFGFENFFRDLVFSDSFEFLEKGIG